MPRFKDSRTWANLVPLYLPHRDEGLAAYTVTWSSFESSYLKDGMRNNYSLFQESDNSILEAPLFWLSLVQCIITLFIFIFAIYTWFTTRITIKRRMKNINWKIQLVEQRLRLQEPNVHLIAQMAKNMKVSFDDVGQDSERILSRIWGQDDSKLKKPSKNEK
ncbi:hypothetical protein RB195_011547 [Necator americanus]|uniref:Uncharacterized protein n=1 Tax=Necator americanus TaxID=51031 RepID=A0ABR1D3S4_NECAM